MPDPQDPRYPQDPRAPLDPGTLVTGLSTQVRYPRQLLPQMPVATSPDVPLPNPEPTMTLGQQFAFDPLGTIVQGVKGALVGGYKAGESTPAAGVGELGMAALPLVGGVKSLLTGRGLYSRIDDLLQAIPERGVHPNKLASLLKSGASQEEVAYRKLPEFLAAKGNQPVTRAELAAHLAANPAPMPQTTVLGAANPARPTALPEGWHIADMGGDRFTLVGRDGVGQLLGANTPAGALDEAISRISNASRTLPTKFQSYSLPGGENYREHLTTLPSTPAPPSEELTGLYRYRDALDQEMRVAAAADPLGEPGTPLVDQWHRLEGRIGDLERREGAARHGAVYRSSHFDQPNILVHARTTERTLPGAPPPEPPAPIPQLTGADLHQQGWTVRVDREEPYSGRRQMTLLNPQGEWSGSRGMTPLTPEEYLHDHALDLNRQAQEAQQAQAAQPTGPRGRFIEEVQSDWHQAGKRSGYQTPLTPEQQQRLAQLPQEIASAQKMVSGHNTMLKAASDTYLDELQAATRPHLPPEYQHLTSFGDATRSGEPAVRAWRQAREIAHQTHTGLPALRTAEEQAQQRLNAAVSRVSALQEEHGQLLQPKGVPDAPFKETWPDLALKQQVLDVAHSPDLDWLGMTSGKTQAERYDLSKQISRLEYIDASNGQHLRGYDLDGHQVIDEAVPPEKLPDYIGKDAADKLLQAPLASGRSWPTRQLEGLDLQVGGEGMRSFYDRLLPKRLQKILKPFGGTVEPGGIPTGTKQMETVPAFTIRDQHGFQRGVWENRADAEAYLANPPDFIDPTRSTIVPTTTGNLREVPTTEPAWFARFTPEMKERIRREGLPLLTAIFGVTAGARAYQSLRDASAREQVGTAPPVQAPPR